MPTEPTRASAATPFDPQHWFDELDRFHAELASKLNGRTLSPADEVIREMREERDAELTGGLR